jgi:hypothetical protein
VYAQETFNKVNQIFMRLVLKKKPDTSIRLGSQIVFPAIVEALGNSAE